MEETDTVAEATATRTPPRIVTITRGGTILSVNQDARTAKMKIGDAEELPVALEPKVFDCLELLATRKGAPTTRTMFLNHVYGGMDEPESKIIDVFICKLRKILQAASNGVSYIETVWGRGYIVNDEESPQGEPGTSADATPTKGRVSYVIGPDGSPLTLSDLPRPGTRHWVIQRKAEVVAAVRGGLLSLDDACKRYTLTAEEFLAWQRAIDRFGMPGLRASRAGQYRN